MKQQSIDFTLSAETIRKLAKNYWMLRDIELIKEVKDYCRVVFHVDYGRK